MLRHLFAACLALAVMPGAAGAEPPKVVATIAPLHSLVAMVMEGVAAPDLLLAATASPHHFQLRPSQARQLAEADAIFWVGPALETALVRPLASVPQDTRVVAMMEAPGVVVLSAEDDEEPEHQGEAGVREQHRHGAQDPHLWLDPRNAAAMARAIARNLAEIDPDQADRYGANAEAVATRLDALANELAGLLAPVRARPAIVFHDAYRYLEARFGLNVVASVTIDPELPAGARHVASLRAQITREGVGCVFVEPQFAPRIVDALIEGTGARTGVLDPLGADLAPGPDLYEAMMRRNGAAIVGCLTPPA